MIENCHLFLYIFISDHALSPWTRPVHLFILFRVQIFDEVGIRLHMASNGYMCLPKRLLNAALPAHTEFVSYAHAASTHFSHCQWYFLSPVYTMTDEQLGLMWELVKIASTDLFYMELASLTFAIPIHWRLQKSAPVICAGTTKRIVILEINMFFLISF